MSIISLFAQCPLYLIQLKPTCRTLTKLLCVLIVMARLLITCFLLALLITLAVFCVSACYYTAGTTGHSTMLPPWRLFPSSTASRALIVTIATVKPHTLTASRDPLNLMRVSLLACFPSLSASVAYMSNAFKCMFDQRRDNCAGSASFW